MLYSIVNNITTTPTVIRTTRRVSSNRETSSSSRRATKSSSPSTSTSTSSGNSQQQNNLKKRTKSAMGRLISSYYNEPTAVATDLQHGSFTINNNDDELKRRVTKKFENIECGFVVEDDRTSVTSIDDDDDNTSTSCSEEDYDDEIQRRPLLLISEQKQQNNSEIKTKTKLKDSSLHKQCIKLCIGIVGVWMAHISYGIVQEDLFRYRDNNNVGFTFVWYLQVLESASSIILGIIGRKLFGGRTDLHIKPFLLSGAAQLFAKCFVSLALVAGASFPVVTLAKCGKVLPVMIGQLILGGSKYGIRDYLFAVFIVGGTVLVSLNKKHDPSSEQQQPGSIFGVLFIVLSLVMDGCSAGLQKQLKTNMVSTPPTTYDFVLYSHLSMISVALIIAIITGDFTSGIIMMYNDTNILTMISYVCILSVIGQSFIFYVVSNFDPLVCATITTTRKMWSVLLSILFKGHHLNAAGYSGLAIAILGLLIEIHTKITSSASSSNKRKQNNNHYELLQTKESDNLLER